jgi:hypothetical protein
MARAGAASTLRWVVMLLGGLALFGAPPAGAFEAFDGRLQVHGYGEIQTRTLAQSYDQDFDLVQWYNVLSVETEVDILPDGWGPFDLVSSYVRIEARYDCVYTHNCGTMPSVDTYGDNAKRVPRRIADAQDEDYAGQINSNDQTVPPGQPFRVFNSKVSPLGYFVTTERPICRPGQTSGKSPAFCYDPNLPLAPNNRPTALKVRDRRGFPGFDTLARLAGGDAIVGPNQFQNDEVDDPFNYLFKPIDDFLWTFRDKRGPDGSTGQTLAMGPWLPKNTIRTLAVLSDRGNPFRGARPPTANGLVANAFQSGPRQNDPYSYRYTELDEQTAAAFPVAFRPPSNLPYEFDPVDPRIAFDSDDDGDLDSGQAFKVVPYPNNRFVRSLVNELPNVLPFAGDFTGIIPCETPDTNPSSNAQNQINTGTTAGCWTNFQVAGAATAGLNLANTGGRGELPLRPGADTSNLNEDTQHDAAQGIFYPSAGLRQELEDVGGDFDQLKFNFDQEQRSWNRGQSQSYTKEFKEGYLDMEFLDSRLWIRAGKQNIVWGKTELFRTTDQFNSQDLALASLPNLEESRIAVWSGRAVYSLYDIGPLQDVRVEGAFNFDHFTPADLGACGEAFTPDLVCGLTLGMEFHGLTGVGIAGINRPPDPWDNVRGIEFGGRVEFRWDRFSFAISDFYGYNDFPHPEPINFYERNVDTASGRPLVAEPLRGVTNRGTCAKGVPTFVRAQTISYPNGVNAAPVTGGSITENGDASVVPIPGGYTPDIPSTTPAGQVAYWDALAPMMGGLGVGTDPNCLKPGGRTGSPNANLLNDVDPVDINGDTIPDPSWNAPALGSADIPALYSPQNAVEFHSANQQLFSFVCLGTVTIAASVDGSSCAWTIFGSPNPLIGAPAAGTILSETFSTIFAGDPSVGIAGNGGLLQIIVQNQKGAAFNPYPIRPANRDLRDGVMTSQGTIFNRDGIAYNPDSTQDLLSLDSVLSPEQRALLGCGPFYGTRCDSSRRDRGAGTGVPFPEGGGVDFLNAEASALMQSWPGIEGTEDGWTTTSRTLTETSTQPLLQPGTIGFANEAFCTRYEPKSNYANDLGVIRLPGCRGAMKVLTEDLANLPANAPIEILFEAGYTPAIDGCVLGVSDPNNPASRNVGIAGHPVVAKRVRLRNDPNFDPNDPSGSAEDISGVLNVTCGAALGGSIASSTRIGTPGYGGISQYRTFAQTAWHPLAGCKTYAQAHAVAASDSIADRSAAEAIRRCDFTNRNFEQEFLQGTAQIFRNELAIVSNNFMTFLAVGSCDSARGGDDLGDPDCFDPRPAGIDENGKPIGAGAWDPNRCSLAAPHFCRNVKGFFAVAGVERNDRRAGGNPRFGRRDFSWHSGGELVLEYARRNVFGFATDFAEDVTKTSWGVEFTYFSDIPFVNNDAYNNVTESEILNLTVSVDRPTFINFMNANRTFFINTQWFFNYITNYQGGGGFSNNGPFNVLFTVAVFTGYFQDRLQPNWVFVYDFGSRSGGLLPSLGYRFTENFSLTVGLNYFFGRGQLKDMPVRGFAPTINRAGEHTYDEGVENVLSPIRRRDEAYFRLRYTF